MGEHSGSLALFPLAEGLATVQLSDGPLVGGTQPTKLCRDISSEE